MLIASCWLLAVGSLQPNTWPYNGHKQIWPAHGKISIPILVWPQHNQNAYDQSMTWIWRSSTNNSMTLPEHGHIPFVCISVSPLTSYSLFFYHSNKTSQVVVSIPHLTPSSYHVLRRRSSPPHRQGNSCRRLATRDFAVIVQQTRLCLSSLRLPRTLLPPASLTPPCHVNFTISATTWTTNT